MLLIVSNFTPEEFKSSITGFIAFLCVILLIGSYISKYKDENVIAFKSKFYKPKNHNRVREMLSKSFPFYIKLSYYDKEKFLQRVLIFLEMKQFIYRKSEKSELISVLISATAVQLTFGLNEFSLFSFNKILIYPDKYYSKIRQTFHNGETNTRLKIIVLSAKHFLFGVQDPNDGRNLGLHEMAHALCFGSFEEDQIDFIVNYRRWENEAYREIEKIKANKNHFLRQYAASNIQEMFAVSTEFFFEKPKEFKEKLPVLFKKLSLVYNQNP